MLQNSNGYRVCTQCLPDLVLRWYEYSHHMFAQPLNGQQQATQGRNFDVSFTSAANNYTITLVDSDIGTLLYFCTIHCSAPGGILSSPAFQFFKFLVILFYVGMEGTIVVTGMWANQSCDRDYFLFFHTDSPLVFFFLLLLQLVAPQHLPPRLRRRPPPPRVSFCIRTGQTITIKLNADAAIFISV